MLELYLYMYQQTYGLDYSVSAIQTFTDHDQDPAKRVLIAIFTGQMLKGNPVTIYGSGEQSERLRFR